LTHLILPPPFPLRADVLEGGDGVSYNEYVIFNPKQIFLRYAVLLKAAGEKTLSEEELQADAAKQRR
jgi:hypothetical protein